MKTSGMRVLVRAFGIAASLAIGVWNYLPSMRALRALPVVIRVVEDSSDADSALEKASGKLVYANESVEVASTSDERLTTLGDYAYTYYLLGRIPVKTVQVLHSEAEYLAAGGQALGITIRTEGVLVVGLGAVETENGALSPGAAAGLKAGDIVLTANGETVKDSAHLSSICENSKGELELHIVRDSENAVIHAQLVKDAATGAWKLGIWARDSTAGVGTLSFVDMETGWFAALGHPVSDVDTQSLLPVRDGRIFNTDIVDVRKGEEGSPGELIGVFSIYDKPLGRIKKNTEYGIYGEISDLDALAPAEMLPMGYAHEAHEGSAQLVATISSEGAERFACEIVRVNAQSDAASKGMVIRITDEKLLKAIGGIVQGMSGCPVIQDGKLLGIVTHVFVNDPTRGYCIYAEWMLRQIREDQTAA